MAKNKIVYEPKKLTFKEKRMIVKAQKNLFSDKEPEMWEHYCEEEKTEMAVGKGEPCNWCGKKEEDCESCS
jgi:hypothetical protein|tara:strand:- start:1045 stop:1257 length:213 start_codon:yes stop_codon:yes gene_type:complete